MRPSRTAARAERGMVASPHPLATEAGLDALRAGGSAVDAAVAANAMLAVVYCNSCGLGGDAFALVWAPQDGHLHGFNGSGHSPAGLTIEAVRDAGHREMPERGPLSITVPGAVEAWVQLLDHFGRRSLADALLPAARIAEEGYRLTAINASSIVHGLATFDDQALAVFRPGGRLPRAGALFRQPLLAASLKAIASGGRDAFYGGPIAAEIVRAVRTAGGVLAKDDLAEHRGDWVEPVATQYGDVEVATTPPNSQGITTLLALNVLSALAETGAWPGLPALRALPALGRLDADRLHAQVEALKVAWSERDRCVSEPRRMLCDMEQLLSPTHARELARRLAPDRAGRFVPSLSGAGGTVYLCAADADGMMVSLIESNYMGFGSGVMGGQTGIMLQNRGAYFRLDPQHPNALAPRARTLHTLMPGMLLREGGAEVALGAMGGDGQPHSMLQLVNALVDDRLDPQQAVDRARFRVMLESSGGPLGPVAIEADGAGPVLVASLQARGHEVTLVEPRSALMGWAQVIRRGPDGSYLGGADPRADSLAAGI